MAAPLSPAPAERTPELLDSIAAAIGVYSTPQLAHNQ
jgi:hypothetical protein